MKCGNLDNVFLFPNQIWPLDCIVMKSMDDH